MTRIGLLAAFKNEVPDGFPHPQPHAIHTHTAGSCEVGVLVSGIGRAKAARATERLCAEFRPELILVLGVCGGADPAVPVGALLLADAVHHDGDTISLDGPPLTAARHCASGTALEHRVGGMQTFDRPVLSRQGIADGMLGVDMEAYAIAKAAAACAIPTVIIKSVSDLIPERQPAFLPGPRLMARFLWHFGAAKRSVNAFARAYFESPPSAAPNTGAYT